jgi:hypothetical protein
MKKSIFFVLLFITVTFVGLVLNLFLEFETVKEIDQNIFIKLLIKSSVISSVLTIILFLFNKNKMDFK